MSKHIFVIPSWYPWQGNRIFGSFIKEQLYYLAHYTDLKISVSLWGQGEFLLQLKNPSQILEKIIRFLFTSDTIIREKENFIGIYSPALSWSNRILNGNIRQLIKTNLINLKKAELEFGKIKLIHAHVSFPAGYIAMELSRLTGIPFIITEHMGPFPLPNFLKSNGSISEQILLPLRSASGVIAVSKFLSEEIKRKTGVSSKVIPNMVNEIFFKCKTTKTDPSRLLYIGNSSPDKGFSLLLESLMLVAEKQKFHLTAIGIRPSMKKIIPSKIAKYVELKGWLHREKVAEEIENSAVFIHPSSYETFGLVVAEALACGKPVVLTSCGGPDSFITNDRGILVKDRSPEKLAEAILEAIKN